MTNILSPRRSNRLTRQLALALALASGTAVLSVPGLTEPAFAQKKKKEEAPKASYSKEFVAAYQPVEAALKAPGADVATLKPQIDALVPLAQQPDEKMALGGLTYNAGVTAKDMNLQLQGMKMMLDSGRVNPDDVAKFNFTAYQIANAQENYAEARTYLQKAIDANYTSESVNASGLQLSMAELYFSENRNAEGLKMLSDAIATSKAAGQPVDERWYKRGVSVAYTNEIVPQVYDFVQGWVVDYPTPDNWRDAVNLTRNLNEFDGPVLLDLLRLGRKAGTLKEKNDYIFYIEAADTRRLPVEVKAVIDDAYAKGTIAKGSDSWVDEQYKTASGLVAEDRAALPSLERDASASSAQLRTVLAAGDTFLSYGDYAKAAQFFERAMAMPGVDRDLALTRLGIAQVGSGNIDAANATFEQISGTRAPIAMLWSAYGQTQSSGATAAAPAAAPAAAN